MHVLGDATSTLTRGLLEVLLLDSIAREPKHGYALIRELEQVLGQPPNRNQVYPLLNRLEKEGILHADRSEGRGRTRYALTGKGVELLKEYRLRPAPFRARIASLWFPSAVPEAAPLPAPAAAPAAPPAPAVQPPAPPAPRPHLLDRLTIEGEAPSPGGHAGGPCQGEIVMRRRAGADRIVLELAGLDPACATCQELQRSLHAVRDRWF